LRNTGCVIALAGVLLLSVGQGWAARPTPDLPPIRLIEVFTTADQNVPGTQSLQPGQSDAAPIIKVYTVDSIARFERRLSEHLPGAAEPAQRIVTQRLARLDQATSRQLEEAATGLAKAVQYGIDRLPAMVIDGRWVVYGLTDPAIALKHLQAWQAEQRR